MKVISVFMRIYGVLMIIGAAESADCALMHWTEALGQAMGGMLIIAMASVMPYVWRGLRRIALAVFCMH